MTPSLYVIGGAGTGKSTFTQQLLDQLGDLGPLIDLHKKPNAKGTIVTLRGHELARGWVSAGLYIGCMREFFPGTDGLDRASSITGEAWLERGGADAYDYIVAEGNTLGTRRFLGALHRHTSLLLVHLYTDDFVKELRFKERGSTQPDQFVRQTATRSKNLLDDMRKLGVANWNIDTADPGQWAMTLEHAVEHLSSRSEK